jgi:hypothetical protein
MSETFDNLELLQHILSYVGTYQYRFIAAVSTNFKAAYQNVFPNDTQTYINAATIEHARICFECHILRTEWDGNSILCCSAAQHGCLAILRYLHWMKCAWDITTSHTAAQSGHLYIVQYLHENGCPME